MFMFINLTFPFSINLKCDPERAITLREEHEEILPGYHMSKVHWNTVMLEGSLSTAFVKELIDHSYEMVIKALPKKQRDQFKTKDGGEK
jgi:predicted DNA-binding protein (MmcQ/YjbR family)